MKSLQFTRTSMCDGAVETLGVVRFEGGSLAVQVWAGTPHDLGDFVGIYTLDGDRIQGPVGEWDLVSGDRLPAGYEALGAAVHLARTANDLHGAHLTETDYLAPDGSLPFAAILAAWAGGDNVVDPWHTEDEDGGVAL